MKKVFEKWKKSKIMENLKILIKVWFSLVWKKVWIVWKKVWIVWKKVWIVWKKVWKESDYPIS